MLRLPKFYAFVFPWLGLCCHCSNVATAPQTATLTVSSANLYQALLHSLTPATVASSWQTLHRTSFMDRYRDLLGTVTNAPISIDGMVFDQALRRLHQSQATYEAMDQQYPSIGVYLQKIGVTPAAFASLPSLSAFQTDLNAIHTAPNQPADLALTNKSPCPQGGQFIDSLAEVDPSKLPIMDYSMEEHFRTTAMFGSYPLGEEADRQLTGIATTVLSNASLPAFVKDHCKSILKAGDSLLHDKLSNLPGSAAGFDQYDEIEAREEEASRTVKDPLIFWSLWWKNRH